MGAIRGNIEFLEFKDSKAHFRECPVCGHRDWCGEQVWLDSGIWQVICRRESSPPVGEKVILGGETFIVRNNTREGHACYELVGQRNKDNYRQTPSFKSKTTIKESSRTNFTADSVEKRDAFYRAFLDMLKLEPYHFERLKEEWGDNTAEWVSAHGIKSLPPTDKVRWVYKKNLHNQKRKELLEKISKMYPEEGIGGFYVHETYGLSFHPGSGIIYPLKNSKGQIIALRLGLDYPDCEDTASGICYSFNYYSGEWVAKQKDSNEKKVVYSPEKKIFKIRLDDKLLPVVSGERKVSGKYKYFYCTSNGGVTYGGEVGLYLPSGGNFNYESVLATEGEKKCIVGCEKLNVPILCIPGVSSFNRTFEKEDGMDSSILDFLEKMGTRNVIVAYDADKSTNKAVLHAQDSFLKALDKKNMAPAIAEWNPVFGKGLDDALLQGVLPTYYRISITN